MYTEDSLYSRLLDLGFILLYLLGVGICRGSKIIE